MMDYEIDLTNLSSKQTDLENQKTEVENIYNDYNNGYLKTISSTEISSLITKSQNSLERLKKGYENTNNWFSKYITEFTSLEDSLSNFKSDSLTSPKEFTGEFMDIFSKVTIPVLQTNGNKDANLLTPKENEKVTGESVLNGNVIDTSNPVGTGTKYNLTDDELAYLAYVAKREQGSVGGAKLELSLMINLYEKNKSKYSSVTDYVKRSGWFATRSTSNYTYPGDDYYNAAKEVVRDGNRYLASNVVEHDWLGDITSISTGSVKNRSDYIPGKTIIHNRMGATYVFIGFAPNGGDPFGYLV